MHLPFNVLIKRAECCGPLGCYFNKDLNAIRVNLIFTINHLNKSLCYVVHCGTNLGINYTQFMKC